MSKGKLLLVAFLLTQAARAETNQFPAFDDKAPKQDDTRRLHELNENAPSNSTIVFNGRHAYKITKAIRFRPDLTLLFHNGAELAPTENVKVEISGPIQAGIFRIFSGRGTIDLSTAELSEVYPQWWGAWNDGSHSPVTTAAMQAALDSGHKVVITRGTFALGELTVKEEGTIISGVQREKSLLKFARQSGSLFNLQTSYVKITDLTLQGTAEGTGSTSTGINFIKSPRGLVHNVRISGFGYGIHVSDYGGNSIDHCYLYKNTRAGIYLSSGAHGVSITGGTEIAGSPFGIVLGKFRDVPFEIDADFAHVTGQMVSVRGAIIEGIHPASTSSCRDCIGGVGMYSGLAQKGVSVSETYFEDMPVALQLGTALKSNGGRQSSAVFNAVFRDNFLSNVKSAVKVGRASHGEISNNHCATVENLFDTSEAGLFDHVKVEGNFGYKNLTSKPFDADFAH